MTKKIKKLILIGTLISACTMPTYAETFNEKFQKVLKEKEQILKEKEHVASEKAAINTKLSEILLENEKIQREKSQEIQRLLLENEKKEAAILALTNSKFELSTKHAEEIKIFSEKIESLNAKIDEIDEENKRITSSAQEKINELNEKHINDIKVSERSHLDQLNLLSQEHAQKIAELNSLISTAEIKIHENETTCNSEKEAIKQDRDQMIINLEDNVRQCKENYTTCNANYDTCKLLLNNNKADLPSCEIEGALKEIAQKIANIPGETRTIDEILHNNELYLTYLSSPEELENKITENIIDKLVSELIDNSDIDNTYNDSNTCFEEEVLGTCLETNSTK